MNTKDRFNENDDMSKEKRAVRNLMLYKGIEQSHYNYTESDNTVRFKEESSNKFLMLIRDIRIEDVHALPKGIAIVDHIGIGPDFATIQEVV
jgi:hypothetical protein